MRRFGVMLLAASFSAGCSEYDLGSQIENTGPLAEDTDVVPPSGLTPPVAICGVAPNPVQPPFEEATWQGGDSYDPEGVALIEYRWTLISKPEGSVATIPPGDQPQREFTPDLAGEYVGQLIVVTEDGRESAPCETTLEAIPREDLWIEMFWEAPGDDMDLHLLAPNGTLWSNKDCHWLNCDGGDHLDWGVMGDNEDDPALDLDDIPDVGPENINISSPQNGVFTIVVDDYPGSVYNAANTVTINVYIDGSLVWTDSRDISGEDSDTTFATIDWPSGTVTGL